MFLQHGRCLRQKPSAQEQVDITSPCFKDANAPKVIRCPKFVIVFFVCLTFCVAGEQSFILELLWLIEFEYTFPYHLAYCAFGNCIVRVEKILF